MTFKTEESAISGYVVKAYSEFNGVHFYLYDNGIYHVRIPKMNRLTMDIINYSLDFIHKLDVKSVHNIFEFEAYADVEPEVRIWAADKKGKRITLSDAIVINNFSQKIITDFYLNVNKPKNQTAVFYSMNKALKWTHEKMKG